MSAWLEAAAPAKLNLALVVGPLRSDGKHEVVTVLERLALADTLALRDADATRVDGFADDTLVAAALEAICAAGETPRRFEVRLTKRIPVAAGLGGGSSDAATALALANRALGPDALADGALHDLAADLGADVPFFLQEGPQLATGDGTTLEPLELPRDYTVLLVLREGDEKSSTRDVYEAFDARDGDRGFDDRRQALRRAVARIGSARDARGASRRTTSPRHRSRQSCSSSERSAPTCPARGRSSTGSSRPTQRPSERARHSRPGPGSGSRHRSAAGPEPGARTVAAIRFGHARGVGAEGDRARPRADRQGVVRPQRP